MSSRKRRSAWTERDEDVLIENWAKRANDLRQVKRNAHIYHDMALEMNSRFSAEEIHVKVKNLKKKYRDEKAKLGSSGNNPSIWKNYSAVHRILGDTAVNNGPIIVKSFSLNTPPIKRQPPSPSPSSSSSSPALDPLSPLLPPSPSSSPAPLSPLPLPAAVPSASLSSSPLSPSPAAVAAPSQPLDTSFTETRRHYNEVEKIMKQQTELLKTLVGETRALTGQVVNALKEHNSSSGKLLCLMEKLIEKL